MLFSIQKSKSGKICLSILLIFSLCFVVGCVHAPSRGWSGPIVSDNFLYVGSIEGKVLALDLSEGEPSLYWDKELEGLQTGGGLLACSAQISTPMSIYGTPAVKDGVVYVGGYDGNIYAIDIETQMMSKFETEGAIIGSPIVAGDLLFVGSSDGRLYALNLVNLSLKWTFETGDKIWSTPEVHGGTVYFGSSDHRLYAIDTKSGEEIWHFEAQAGILSTPLVVDDTIYTGSCDYNFYAIDAATGEEKWVFEAESWFWTQALYYPDNNEIWVGCLDHKVYALDAGSGQKIWEYETSGRIRTPPVLVDGLIIIGSEDGNVHKIDPQDKKGAVLWPLTADEETEGVPILAPLYPDPIKGVVYVHAQNGKHMLYAIDVKTGDELWSFETGM